MLGTLESPRGYSAIERRRLESALKRKRNRADSDQPARVLVVEDTPDVRKLMKFILEGSGVQVTTLGDGQSASEMIENWPAPDLVVMDRMLPYMSGDDLLQRIREDETWCDVSVVVVSAKASGDEVSESMAFGANEYVTKPFNSKHFVEVVGRYV